MVYPNGDKLPKIGNTYKGVGVRHKNENGEYDDPTPNEMTRN